MSSTYYWPPDNSSARATALTPWGSGLLLPEWTSGGIAWGFFGTGLSTTAISPATGLSGGFLSAATDAASASWSTEYSGSVADLSSGNALTIYALPSGIFTGTAYVPTYSGTYVVSATGGLYITGHTPAVTVGAGFGAANLPAWALASSGTTLYTLLAATSGLGTFALSSSGAGTSGLLATTMNVPACVAAISGFIAVGGWSSGVISSGFTGLAFDPAAQTNLLATQSGSNVIALYQSSNENWTLTQSITGSGAPGAVAWAPNGASGFVADTTHNAVSVVGFTGSGISIAQTLAVSGAKSVAIISDSAHGLVAQPAVNNLTPLVNSGASWATGAPLTLAGAATVLAVSASGIAAGYASGVAFYGWNGTTWSVSASATLPFTPNSLAVDATGNVYAAGSQGTSGYLSIFAGATVQQTVTWAGSGVGVVYSRAQIVVGDPSASILRIFGQVSGSYSQQASAVAPTGLDALALGALTLFAAGTSMTQLMQFTSPYHLAALRIGAVGVYTGGTWHTAQLGANQWPEAVAFDPSGNVSVATLQNTLYSVASGGTILSSGTIAQYSSQPQTTPIGISALAWLGGHLYAASSLAGALVEIE